MKLSNDSPKLSAVFLSGFLLLAGCSGGTSASSTTKTGILLDSAIEGLNYSTASQSGITEAGGVFRYVEGEMVTFFIGKTVIGQTAAKERITPIELVPGASDEINPKVTNICRLLQSLDSDGVPENGIRISQQTREIMKNYSVDLTLGTVEFEISSTVKDLFGELNRAGVFSDQVERRLRTADQARAHFRETLRSFEPGMHGPYQKTFASAYELEAYLKEQYASGLLSTSAYSTDIAAAGGSGGGSGGNGGGGYEAGYSSTNIQEAGVDEPDKVKTDGTYLYIAGPRRITLVKAVPAAKMAKVGTVDVNGTVDSLHLYNNILAALYVPDGGAGKPWRPLSSTYGLRVGTPYWVPVKAQTTVRLLDVSDPANPHVIKDIVIDGSLISSRLSEGRLHVIQQFLPDLPPLNLWYDGTEKDRTDALAANVTALAPLSLKDLVPGVKVADDKGQFSGTTLLVAPANFSCPLESGGGSIVSVTTIDLDAASYPYRSVGVVADAQTVYSTTQSLYVAASRKYYKAGSSANDVPKINEETALHRFNLTGAEVKSVGSGKVPGTLLNQFSLGEYEGVLRIATTTGSVVGNPPAAANHVFCLQSGTEGLEVIGRLENIAAGEKIYSARFIGRRGFLVTFVKVDPLFTLDLSNPAAPRVMGELKVPGYSDYIHPLDEHHLITIGKDTKLENGTAWYQGVQLSVFDITDFTSPKLMHKQLIGVRGTSSEALTDHRAFTFWNERSLLAIPIDLYEYRTPPTMASTFGTRSFVGLYGYRVSLANGFEPLGRISTVDIQPNKNYYARWMRGVFIGDSVYAVQADSVSSAQIDDIGGTVKRIIIDNVLPPGQYY